MRMLLVLMLRQQDMCVADLVMSDHDQFSGGGHSGGHPHVPTLVHHAS